MLCLLKISLLKNYPIFLMERKGEETKTQRNPERRKGTLWHQQALGRDRPLGQRTPENPALEYAGLRRPRKPPPAVTPENAHAPEKAGEG